MKQQRDPNDNTATRFIAFTAVLLIVLAVIAVIESFVFVGKSHMLNSSGEYTDYSIGAGLCLIAAALALGSALFAIINLIRD